MLKKGGLTGLLLFGMFFGASNLIYPPQLGREAGNYFGLGISGFLISGVGIAIIGLMLGLLNKEGFIGLMQERFPRWCALLVLTFLYLTIGPFFAIPRTATVSFEVGLLPITNDLFGTDKDLLVWATRFSFMFVFFGLGLWIAINPKKILSRIGKVMTPIFALLILLLCLLGFLRYRHLLPNTEIEAYSQTKAFGSGFLAGYNTLDTLASVAFSVVALNTLKTFGFKTKKEYIWTVWIVGGLTALCFSILYIGLGFLGNRMPINLEDFQLQKMSMGAYLLTRASRDIFGWFGQGFLGVMVVLTCFTTMVGLVVATSEFFAETFPRFSYKEYTVAFIVIGFILGNVGLNTIVKISLPILMILYPIIMMMILIILLNRLIPFSKEGMGLSLITVSIISFFRVLSDTFKIQDISKIFRVLPLYQSSLEWLIPGILVLCIGLFVGEKVHSKGISLDWICEN